MLASNNTQPMQRRHCDAYHEAYLRGGRDVKAAQSRLSTKQGRSSLGVSPDSIAITLSLGLAMLERLMAVVLAGCTMASALYAAARIELRAYPEPSALPKITWNQKKIQEEIRTFVGTIAKNGDKFVLNESNTHKLYELDDQNAARKFANQNVTITGTLDAVKNIIRIQSIAEAAA